MAMRYQSAKPKPERHIMNNNPLFTDLYQLTMLAGYFKHGLLEKQATFDLYFRRAPFGGSYAVFAGLENALEYLENVRFTTEHLEYLKSLKMFDAAFLEYLRGWKFKAKVTAIAEGRVVFPNEPLLTVTGALGEAQLVETALLNILNFQTLVATKAARCVHAANSSHSTSGYTGGSLIEFGARRAQGPNGALSAARAAFIGGAVGTSNVEAGQTFGMQVTGTHAHSWVEAFDSELEAFRAYANTFPDSATLLLDTFDTLESGLPNAITVAKELEAAGHKLRGVRLDSGDLAYLSRRIRSALDAANLGYVQIVASNDLDEHVIEAVIREGGRIDVYGVGTQLATGGGEGGGALGGVYKLVQLEDAPKMKLTADRVKSNIPGIKRVWRANTPSGEFAMDVVALETEMLETGNRVTDPTNPLRTAKIPNAMLEDIRRVVMQDGERLTAPESLETLQARAAQDLARLPEGSARLLNPHVYRVSITDGLLELRSNLIGKLEATMA
jgi:nicotinate phosphoribosyltransferase